MESEAWDTLSRREPTVPVPSGPEISLNCPKGPVSLACECRGIGSLFAWFTAVACLSS